MEDRVNLVLADCGESVGGSERLIWELATRLPRARFDTRVWLSAGVGMDPLADAFHGRGVPVERMPDVDSWWGVRGLVGIWLRLRRARPSLLHIHHPADSPDRLPAFLAEAAGAPRLVVTEQADAALPQAPRPLRRRTLECADAVAAECGAVANDLIRGYGLDRDRVRVVPSGVDMPEEGTEHIAARKVRQHLGTGALRPLWVCAARLEPHKGHSVLLEALVRVQERGLDFTAALVGEGSLRGSLERLVDRLRLRSRVRFLGRVEDLGPLLQAADAVLFPSRWEAVPRVLLEALVRARPVVASAVGGMPEVVEDGVSGRLVPPGDPIALADVLEALHRQPERGLELGANAARRVRDEYSWAHVVETVEAIYDEVLGLASFAPERGTGGRVWR